MRYGYFDDAAREYVIDRVDCPQSLTNYLGTQRMGAVVSHNAGGYCWLDSPEHHRITRFRPNGVQLDYPGHWVYLRDHDSGKYWSVSWQPVGLKLDEAEYEARHGLSYSVYRCRYDGISASQTLFIPREAGREDPVEIFDVRLRNESDRVRSLSVYGYVEFSFHLIEIDNQNFQMSLYCAGSDYRDGAVICDLRYEEGEEEFFASDGMPDGFEGTRDAFIGPYRTERNPLGLERKALTGTVEKGGNPVGALKRCLALAPGEEKRWYLVLGINDGGEGCLTPEAFEGALARTKAHWAQVGAASFSTGDDALDGWLRWVAIQPELRRICGCSGRIRAARAP